MTNDFDQSKLLDAVLSDESWDGCSARVHDSALAALRVVRKSRSRRRTAAQILATLAFLGLLCWTVNKPERGWPVRGNPQVVSGSPRSNPVSAAPAAPAVTYISEDQMLAMFPQGSCVLAEVNGQKQLVVLNEK